MNNILCVLLAAACIIDARTISENQTIYRLDSSIIPVKYNLNLSIFLDETPSLNFTFNGLVRIILKTVTLGINKIVLNTKDLEIKNIEVASYKSKINLKIVSFIENKQEEKLIIYLDDVLKQEEKYVLLIEFSGKIHNDLKGLYRSRYINGSGYERWMAVTQFEPVSARKAFPCFDEPIFKARFKLKITHSNLYRAYSNTKIEKSLPTESRSRNTDVFEKTPYISTYSLAFLLTEFQEWPRNSNFSFILNEMDVEKASFGLTIGPSILSAMDDYTGIPYNSVKGIKKLNFVAVNDFATEAMENWGLVTFKGQNLLTSDVKKSFNREIIATVMAHEIVHMWFGNLVTCEWWSYTWLNEGFASYYQDIIVDSILPEFQLDLTFNVNVLHVAFLKDSPDWDYRPLTDFSIQSAEQSEVSFGSLTYKKGASIVRMLDHVFGSTNFQIAIRKYLRANAFKTVTSSNLVDSLNLLWFIHDVSLEGVIRDWTEQTGYPIVSIQRTNSTSFHIYQEVFVQDKQNEYEFDQKKQWTIPVSFTTNVEADFSNTSTKIFLKKFNPFVLSFSENDEPEWLIANIGQTGFYRVNYSSENWHNIAAALKSSDFGKIGVLNRVQIIDDVLNLANSRYTSYLIAFEVLEYLESETHYLPWVSAFRNLEVFTNRLRGTTLQDFSSFMKKLLIKVYSEYEKISFPSRNRIETDFRDNLKNWACFFEVPDCMNTAMLSARSFSAAENESDNEFFIFCTAIKYNSDYYWDIVFSKSKKYFLVNALISLSCANDNQKLEILMKYILEGLKNSALIFYLIQKTSVNKDFYLEFIFRNFPEIYRLNNKSDVENLLGEITSLIISEEQLKIFENIANEFLSDEHMLITVMRKARFSLFWSENFPSQIQEYFQGQQRTRK